MQFSLEDTPFGEDVDIIGKALRQHNEAIVSADGDSRFAVILRNENGRILGGVIAKAGRGWLKVGSMWVDASLRGQGYGTRLLATAEAEGARRGCHSAYLDTFSFQAPEFYLKLGYEIFGTLEAFPDEHKRFFVRKSLPHAEGENRG